MDGFASAMILNLFLKSINEAQNALFFPAQYKETPLPEESLYEDADVYILDFSYPKETLEKIKSKAKSIVVLDHHESAQRNLDGLEYAIFDMEKSGATLTWQFFFPDKPVPEFIKHIEDRDLWGGKHNNEPSIETNKIIAALGSYEKEFDLWESFLDKENLQDLKEEGKHILRYKQETVKKVTKAIIADSSNDRINIAGHMVRCINCTHLASEICGELCKGEKFAATYSCSKGKKRFSLRSEKDVGENVAIIAEKFGGGGHENASGFSIPENLSPEQFLHAKKMEHTIKENRYFQLK